MCNSDRKKTWWVSATPLGRNPGNDEYDIDFCRATCHYDTSPLPGDSLKWEMMDGKHVIPPIPKISLKSRYPQVSTAMDQDVSDGYGWNDDSFDAGNDFDAGDNLGHNVYNRSNSPEDSSEENDNASTEGIGEVDGDDE